MLQSTVADEELQRNNWIAIVNHNIIKAISQVESTEREMSISIMMVVMMTKHGFVYKAFL